MLGAWTLRMCMRVSGWCQSLVSSSNMQLTVPDFVKIGESAAGFRDIAIPSFLALM